MCDDTTLRILIGALRSSATGRHNEGGKTSKHVYYDAYHGFTRYSFEECPDINCDHVRNLIEAVTVKK